jgi:16S rRNA (cytosine967-C5)-methyltransferase
VTRRPASGRSPADDPGVAARRLALDALVRIESEGAYANLVTNALLDRSALADRDRHFVTDLVYGTTRMRRACDHLVDRHRRGDVTPRVAAVLRMGAYQLAFAGVPAHAAVDATVSAAPKPARGLVNAVLRRVADDVSAGISWPDAATELSYPDWIVDELGSVLGHGRAMDALAAMNAPATTHVRPDGYVQDLASQEVVALVDASAGDTVLDLCAAPGGKATGLASGGARVVAADLAPARARLVADNARRLHAEVPVAVADASSAPFRRRSFDRVLVDAPCSGLGVLRRRPDARWRVEADAPERLGELQVDILQEASELVGAGGRLVYSVCTLTGAETDGVLARADLTDFDLVERRTMVPDAHRDGMFVAIWERRS